MNQIIRYGLISDIPLYNCSGHTGEEWAELKGVRRPLYGICDITYGIIFNTLYIPIISVLLEKENIKMSCYKIMVYLVIVDMSALSINSIVTGFLAYHGAVYCVYPRLIYLCGMTSLGLWCCSCLTAMVLVVNRLIDMVKPRLAEFLFHGTRMWISLTVTSFYGLYFVAFTPPAIFSSKYHTWMFDPMIFENRTEEYANIPHGINNFLVVTITCMLYLSFCFALDKKVTQTGANSKASKMSMQIFLQSAMICAINQIASIVYVIMNFITIPFWLIIMGHTMWQFGHGAPALIYLSLNKTIRDGFRRKFMGASKKLSTVTPSVAYTT